MQLRRETHTIGKGDLRPAGHPFLAQCVRQSCRLSVLPCCCGFDRDLLVCLDVEFKRFLFVRPEQYNAQRLWVHNYRGFLLAILPPGAFIGLGLLLALKNLIDHRLRIRRKRQLAVNVVVEPT